MKKKILLIAMILALTACSNGDKKAEEKAGNEGQLKTEVSDDSKKEESNEISKEGDSKINESEDEDFKELKDKIDEKDILESSTYSSEYGIEGDYISQSKEADAIVIGRVLDRGEGRVLKEGWGIYTPIKIEVLSLLKGDPSRDFSTIEQIGGVTTARNYRDFNFEESNKKMGLDKLSDEEQDKKYIAIYPEEYKELKGGGVYVFYLGDPEDESLNYVIQMDAYSILSLDSNYEESKEAAKLISENPNKLSETDDIYFTGKVDGKVSLKDIVQAAKE